jgi:hypothetical protein
VDVGTDAVGTWLVNGVPLAGVAPLGADERGELCARVIARVPQPEIVLIGSTELIDDTGHTVTALLHQPILSN